MESRLTELETRVAFQDHALQELSDVVARQQREIDQLRLLLEALRAQLATLASSGTTHPREEPPPPHY
jgi:SlyX protein